MKREKDWLDLDIHQVEPKPLSAQQKTNIKKHVLSESKMKKKFHIPLSAAAIVFASIIVLSLTINIANPALAAKIPIIGNIFEVFSDDEEFVFEDYDAHSTSLGDTQDNNGIGITVTDAVYDGENITIAYMMTSDKDLGDKPILDGNLDVVELDDKFKITGGHFPYFMTKKISDHEYAGLFVLELIEGTKPEKINVTWDGHTVLDLNNANNAHPGDWTFGFTLDALEREPQQFTKDRVITETEGIEISVTEMQETPISTTFYLSETVDERLVSNEEEELRVIILEYKLTDDLGNRYQTIHNEGTGHSTGFDEKHVNHARLTTTILDENATSITITPIVNVYEVVDFDGNMGAMELVEEPYTVDPIEVPLVK